MNPLFVIMYLLLDILYCLFVLIFQVNVKYLMWLGVLFKLFIRGMEISQWPKCIYPVILTKDLNVHTLCKLIAI